MYFFVLYFLALGGVALVSVYNGEVAEWSKAPPWKGGVGET